MPQACGINGHMARRVRRSIVPLRVQSGSPLQGEASAAPGDSVAIHLTADADALARIANVVLLANTPPWRVLLTTEGAEVHMEIELRDVEQSIVGRICRKLTQLTCVTEIELQVRGAGV